MDNQIDLDKTAGTLYTLPPRPRFFLSVINLKDMAPSKTKHSGKRKSPALGPKASGHQPSTHIRDVSGLEFHRHASAMMPADSDRYPAVAYCVEPRDGRSGQRFCTCGNKGRGTCAHLKLLAQTRAAYEKAVGTAAFSDHFKAGFWHRLAVLMADGGRQPLETVQLMHPSAHGAAPDQVASDQGGAERGGALVVLDKIDQQCLLYLSAGADRHRFVERCLFSQGKQIVPSRADVLQRLTLLTTTANEEVMQQKGFKSARQLLEESFWYRFAYHCYREFGQDSVRLQPFIDDASGGFFLAGKDGIATYFDIPVPRKKVKQILKELGGALTNDHQLAIQPLSLDAIFDVTLNDALDMEIRPFHRLIRKNGEMQFYKREDLEKYKYGDLYFIKELGVLVEDHYPAPRPDYLDPVRTLVQRSQIPHFLADHGIDLSQPLFHLDESVKKLKIVDTFDRLVITPEALDRNWWWLSVDYGQGDLSISLADILQAKLDGQRFVGTGCRMGRLPIP